MAKLFKLGCGGAIAILALIIVIAIALPGSPPSSPSAPSPSPQPSPPAVSSPPPVRTADVAPAPARVAPAPAPAPAAPASLEELREAATAASAEISAARKSAVARLEKTARYRKLAATVASLEKSLAQARKTGTPQAKLDASSKWNKARMRLSAMRAEAAENDKAVAAARERLDSINTKIAPLEREASARAKAAKLRAARIRRPMAAIEVGAVGVLGEPVEILTIVDDDEMVVLATETGVSLWITGFSTAGQAEGKTFSMGSPIEVTGTRQYETLLGLRTAYEVEPAE